MPGATRKNTKFDIVAGDQRPSLGGSDASSITAGMPKMPNTISEGAAKYWPRFSERLKAIRVTTKSEVEAVELLCETYAEWRRLSDYIDSELGGVACYETTTKDGGEMRRAHPEFALRGEAHKRLHRLLSDFGLTPAARSKVMSLEAGKKKVDPWGAF